MLIFRPLFLTLKKIDYKTKNLNFQMLCLSMLNKSADMAPETYLQWNRFKPTQPYAIT